MRRVLVIGCSGAGKSTLARKLSAVTGLPLVGLDRIYWRSGCDRAAAFRMARRGRKARGRARLGHGREYYSGTFDLRMPRADTVIWLDYPRKVCLRRVLWRVIKGYGRTRADMPPGCPEKLRQFLNLTPH